MVSEEIKTVISDSDYFNTVAPLYPSPNWIIIYEDGFVVFALLLDESSTDHIGAKMADGDYFVLYLRDGLRFFPSAIFGPRGDSRGIICGQHREGFGTRDK